MDGEFEVTVTFSEDVTGFDAADVVAGPLDSGLGVLDAAAIEIDLAEHGGELVLGVLDAPRLVFLRVFDSLFRGGFFMSLLTSGLLCDAGRTRSIGLGVLAIHIGLLTDCG